MPSDSRTDLHIAMKLSNLDLLHLMLSSFLTNARFRCVGPTRYLNYIFTAIFIVEAFIRLVALRFDYFKQGWNVFDFIIVIFSIVGEYLT